MHKARKGEGGKKGMGKTRERVVVGKGGRSGRGEGEKERERNLKKKKERMGKTRTRRWIKKGKEKGRRPE